MTTRKLDGDMLDEPFSNETQQAAEACASILLCLESVQQALASVLKGATKTTLLTTCFAAATARLLLDPVAIPVHV